MRRLLIALGLLAISTAPALAYMILAKTGTPPPAVPEGAIIVLNNVLIFLN